MNTEKLGQIQLPAPEDFDPHPRLLLNGRGIHAGDRKSTRLNSSHIL